MSANQYDDDLIIELDDDIEDEQGAEQDSGIEASADAEQSAKKPSRAEKRINELTWKAKTAEERAALLEQELAELRQAQAEASKAKTSERLEELKKQYAEALEYGDNEKAAELNEEMLDIKLELREQGKKTPQQPQQEAQPQPQQPLPQKTEAQLQFEQQNADWIDKDPERTQKANVILQKLHKHGYRADDPRMWKLLEVNLNKQARPSAETGGQITREQAGRLTQQDIQEMKSWNLDPTNKVHQEQWLKAKAGK